MDARGCPPSAPGVILGSSWGSPGMLQSARGLLWDTLRGAWACNLELWGMIFVFPSSLRGEKAEKLEFHDPLNENTRFLKSQGLQNEVKIVPKRTEKRKKSRASPEKSAQVCRRVPRERSGAFLRDTASPAVSPGGGGGSPAPPSDFSGLTCYFLGFGSISGPEASET